MKSILYLVIPCYIEQEVLPETSRQLLEKMTNLIKKDKISEESKIMFVNDGSKDKTWEIIEKLHSENDIFQGVCLSRNKGHQNALLAGLMTAKEYCEKHIYLSTHTFYGSNYKYATKMLQECGFDIEIDNWDKEIIGGKHE